MSFQKLIEQVMGKSIEAIIWADACQDTIDKEDTKLPIEMLSYSITYGRIYKEDTKAVSLIYSENSEEADVITIPKKWVLFRIPLHS